MSGHKSIRYWFCTSAGMLLYLAVTLSNPGHARGTDAVDTGGSGILARYLLHAQDDMNKGRFTDAISYCDRAIALNPTYIRAHFTRGEALLASGQYDAAIVEFMAVIAAHPEYPMVHMYRGMAYLRQRKAGNAISDFNQALTAEIGMRPTMAADIFSSRSLAYELIDDGASSVADFDRAMKAVYGDTFHDYDVLNTRCYNAALAGLLDSALESCDESITRHARDEDVYDSRGLVYLRMHDWDKALADYSQSLYYKPNLTLSLYGRGIAKLAKRDVAGGNADIDAAKQGEPNIAEIMTRFGVPPDIAKLPAPDTTAAK